LLPPLALSPETLAETPTPSVYKPPEDLKVNFQESQSASRQWKVRWAKIGRIEDAGASVSCSSTSNGR